MPFAALLMLSGCIGLAIGGGEYLMDQNTISAETAPATAGDPAAQYRLGEAYCCAALRAGGFRKNNETATVWLCRSAGQGYAPAQWSLARIYAGDRIRGLALHQRVMAGAVGVTSDKPVALYWARQAAAAADPDVAAPARALAENLERDMTPEERDRARRIMSTPAEAPCLWHEVFPPVEKR